MDGITITFRNDSTLQLNNCISKAETVWTADPDNRNCSGPWDGGRSNDGIFAEILHFVQNDKVSLRMTDYSYRLNLDMLSIRSLFVLNSSMCCCIQVMASTGFMSASSLRRIQMRLIV